MSELLYELPLRAAERYPERVALRHKNSSVTFAVLGEQITACAAGLMRLGLARHDRVAVYLPKQVETVVAMFGAARAGMAFVPVNPILKPQQVAHILGDCNVRVLVTSHDRAQQLHEVLATCPDLRFLVIVDRAPDSAAINQQHIGWTELLATGDTGMHRVIDADLVSIFYTSGSTGKPKGVVLSHKNMVTGARSVAQYLENTADDTLLAVLPFSFDYGFSQLSTAFHVGASVVLLDHLFARDVVNTVARERITGLAGVPPLWMQLAPLEWPQEARDSLRYITNSGGSMPLATLARLRSALPKTRPFLMYGLTEAFRSTFLPPDEIDRRPGSIGRAIPNAEILVVRPDGSSCDAEEPGELVHRGSLVALGYWSDPVKTAERFRPLPGQNPALVLTETAVWSGDTVRKDADGYLYFVGRRDEMIKTSGYRVSPTEIEEALYASGLVADAVAVGVPHASLGQAVAVLVAPAAACATDTAKLLDECRQRVALYMVPAFVEWCASLPRNPNGKFDRPLIARQLAASYAAATQADQS